LVATRELSLICTTTARTSFSLSFSVAVDCDGRSDTSPALSMSSKGCLPGGENTSEPSVSM